MNNNQYSIPQNMCYNTKFSTWVIAYCIDTASFYVTDERFWYWQFNKEFDTELEGIEYFENHVNDFINIEQKLRSTAMIGYYADPFNNPVFLHNTRKFYKYKNE